MTLVSKQKRNEIPMSYPKLTKLTNNFPQKQHMNHEQIAAKTKLGDNGK